MNDDRRPPASPPCYRHETQDESNVAGDVDAWRRRERQRLRSLRNDIGEEDRVALDEAIGRRLDALLDQLDGRRVAVYWPLPGEPELQEWYVSAAGRGATLLLPLVVERNAALQFRRWRPGEELVADVLGIPSPAEGPAFEPEIVVTPVVGFDQDNYRLGNGGGYYDRTLAVLDARPRLVGVGYERCAIRSIYPQPHDVPMDHVVTDEALHGPAD